jgi:hypothetical protein
LRCALPALSRPMPRFALQCPVRMVCFQSYNSSCGLVVRNCLWPALH